MLLANRLPVETVLQERRGRQKCGNEGRDFKCMDYDCLHL